MSGLLNIGYFCMIISIWGTIQLFIMGICYKCEVVTLLEDVEEEVYEDYDDFIKKTEKNYAATSTNCFIAAVVYAVFIAVSYGCIVTAKRQMKKQEKLDADDEIFCLPKPPPKKDPKKIL